MNSYPQQFQRKLNIFPVNDGEGLIENIYSGGHNNVEHQLIDIDGDEDLDIPFLDGDGTFGWYENIGDKFNPDFEYSLTPIGNFIFSDWFYFVDIDADNDLDYFTGNVDHISFYENIGSITSPLFILNQDTVRDNEGQPIFSEFGSNPVFADVDNDNDFDFITGNAAGTLTFYENIGTPQLFNFKFITSQWQDIIIIGGILNDHGASSIDFVDIDADNDLDLFLGDFFSKSLYYIENQGTASLPDMQLVSNIYPINADSIQTSGFNMPRFADIDADNDYDLFVSVLYDPTVPQSLMFYSNNGTAFIANHSLVTEDFLKTLDVGNTSAPSFVDIDNDNDLDIILGSLNNPFGKLHFLKNIGTPTSPAFEYLDSSYFGIESDLSVSPTLADLDNDNDPDMIIGKFNGKLLIYNNSGNPSSPMFTSGESLLDNNGVEIDIGTTAVPFLIDIDNDFDSDLIIGAFNGKVSLYRNTGTSSGYQFTLIPDYFGTIDVGDNSTPFIIDYNNDGNNDLFTGNRNGEFYYFQNEGTNVNPVWNEVTNSFLPVNFGANTAPYFVDIDSDNDTDLFLGNVKGGLYLYINMLVSNVADREIEPISTFSVKAFPNPFNPKVSLDIHLNNEMNIIIEIYNIIGEKVKQIFNGSLSSGEHRFTWDGMNEANEILPSGNYIILARSALVKKA
ncbi:MAG: FG-GAP-like repeat-containing protein, partial [Ignavibacteriaceae bacterium]